MQEESEEAMDKEAVGEFIDSIVMAPERGGPEPAYVKVSTNNGAYAPYPDDPVGQQELVYWYNSLAAPMTVVAEVRCV